MGFDTASLAQASIYGQIGGALTSAVGSYYGAQSQASSLRFQGRMAEINAQIAELGAKSEMAAGQRQEQALRLNAAQLKSRQRASIAANGIDLSSDTAQNILNSTDLMKEIDAQTIQANAVRSAWGYRTQAVNDRNAGLLARASASSISPAGAAATSLLGSATTVAGSWYDRKRLTKGRG